MTYDQIRAEVAKIDGWKQAGEIWYRGELSPNADENCMRFDDLPDYPNSRDAIVPVIEKQTADVQYKVAEFFRESYGVFNNMLTLFFATPRQLCEALLRATGRWKE